MTAPVYCEKCETVTHPTLPHSCFSAAALRAHKEAEQAVIEAAKAFFDLPTNYTKGAVFEAVAALRAVEGGA
jgi:hypothetical protein